MASLDTNCLLRFALNDIPEQAAIVEGILTIQRNIQVADAAIIEMVYVLEKLYQMPRDLIAAHLEILVSVSSINCNRLLISKILPNYLTHPKLSFMDCYLAIYAELNQAKPLLTFDQKLASQLEQAELAR